MLPSTEIIFLIRSSKLTQGRNLPYSLHESNWPACTRRHPPDLHVGCVLYVWHGARETYTASKALHEWLAHMPVEIVRGMAASAIRRGYNLEKDPPTARWPRHTTFFMMLGCRPKAHLLCPKTFGITAQQSSLRVATCHPAETGSIAGRLGLSKS
jgi:hypothetical protein